LRRIILVVVILQSDFFQRKFHVHLNSPPGHIDHNDEKLHTIVYLQVAIISQALIFVTRSHSFFFMERPSYALMGAFCLAQLVSSIIAGFANWGFTHIQKISAAWIGIVWVWVSDRSC
jgi:H+-transporting ATPase